MLSTLYRSKHIQVMRRIAAVADVNTFAQLADL